LDVHLLRFKVVLEAAEAVVAEEGVVEAVVAED
jgi:hypothetical protein